MSAKDLGDRDSRGEARSLLFVPADRPDRFEKAAAAGADLVILDLEDGIAPDLRQEARRNVRSWLSSGRHAGVRINSVDSTDHRHDLEALTGAPGLQTVMVAKAEKPLSVSSVAERACVPVIALIETALGLTSASALASARGVARLAFGHLDYATDLGAVPSWEAMLHARSTLVVASRAARLPGPIDGVTTTLDDPANLRQDVLRAQQMGMTGKLLIHPHQVEPTHDAFLPCADDVRWAKEVVAGMTCAAGAARVNGEMVDAPILARAEAILRRLQ